MTTEVFFPSVLQRLADRDRLGGKKKAGPLLMRSLY